MKKNPYNELKKRRAAWRKELKNEHSKYSRKLVLSTISAINTEIIAVLKSRAP